MIGSDGAQIGVIPTREALSKAQGEGLDLVLVAGQTTPPVVRIVDYGKFKYQEGKLGKDKKHKQQEVKGIKISPRIAEHDVAFMVKNAIKFLEEGCKVRVVCQFKAREIAHPDIGRQKLDHFAELVKDHGIVERTPVLDGKLMTMILTPKPVTAGKKNAKDQNQQDSGQEVQDNRVGEDHEAEIAQQPSISA